MAADCSARPPRSMSTSTARRRSASSPAVMPTCAAPATSFSNRMSLIVSQMRRRIAVSTEHSQMTGKPALPHDLSRHSSGYKPSLILDSQAWESPPYWLFDWIRDIVDPTAGLTLGIPRSPTCFWGGGLPDPRSCSGRSSFLCLPTPGAYTQYT